jgi:hypothetical protein
LGPRNKFRGASTMHSKLKNVHLIFIFKRRQKWVIYVFILLQVLEKHDHELEGVYLAQVEI